MDRIAYSLIFLLTLFLVSQFVFEPTNLYYELKWLDIPMHIFGGMGVGALWHAIASYRGKKASLAGALLFFASITAIWELYEFVRGVMVYDETSDYFDTVFDTINGAIGAYLAHFLATSSNWGKQKK